MVRLEKSADPSVYPTTAWVTAVEALWSAWPALLLFPTGRIAAINQLTRWVTGLSPASLLDMNILELSAHLLGSQRAPATCNASFIVKKIESVERLPSGRQQFLPFFIERYEEAVKVSSSPTEVASCPIMRGGEAFSDATPWHYPLFIQAGPDESEDRLLQFTVIEACLEPKNHYLIILEPAESRAKKVVAKIYRSWQQRFPDEEYVVARSPRVDIILPSEYQRGQLRNPKIDIIDIEELEEIHLDHNKDNHSDPHIPDEQEGVVALESGALVGVPVFEFRPRQSLSEHDLHRIAHALGAQLVALPKHPELGPGTGFRLGSDAVPGRVTQVDVYLGRSQTKSAAVRVHRVDDFGEPHAPRYRFDVGYLQEGESPALVFRAPERNQERVITVFQDGRFDEVAGLSRANAIVLTMGEESLAKLPPVFSVTDVAARLGITRAAVLAAIDRGRLAAHKIDGQWEIAREDFAAYRQSTAHRRGAPAQV